MDVLYFLKERTHFIRNFYDSAASPFREVTRKIDAKEAPFSDPPYNDDGDPPYFEEWSAADTSLEILGRSCVSLLSASLQLYFMTWERELGIVWEPGDRETAFKKGFLHGYQSCFAEALNIAWAECPVDFDVVEQVILARNRDQHPDYIDTLRVTHAPPERKRFAELFFIRDTEKAIFADERMRTTPWMSPTVHVTKETLFAAIEQVETLCEWLENRMVAAKYPR
jgi:hypothetical protein